MNKKLFIFSLLVFIFALGVRIFFITQIKRLIRIFIKKRDSVYSKVKQLKYHEEWKMYKQQHILVPIPTSIDASYKALYEQKSLYVCPELGVKKYRNVFVSHEGLCLQHFRLLPYSSFNICTKYDKSFGWQYYKLVVEQYLVSTFGKSLKSMV